MKAYSLDFSWRTFVALIAAPLLPAMLFAFFNQSLGGTKILWPLFQATVMITETLALMIGIPLLFFLRSRLRFNTVSASLAGAVVAAVPFLSLFIITPSTRAADFWPTIGFLALIFGLGALGGWVFWALVKILPHAKNSV